jgi:hypothetical protein
MPGPHLISVSDDIRIRQVDFFNRGLSNRPGATGSCVVLPQRLHTEDLIGTLVTMGQWEHLVLPNEYQSDTVYGSREYENSFDDWGSYGDTIRFIETCLFGGLGVLYDVSQTVLLTLESIAINPNSLLITSAVVPVAVLVFLNTYNWSFSVSHVSLWTAIKSAGSLKVKLPSI